MTFSETTKDFPQIAIQADFVDLNCCRELSTCFTFTTIMQHKTVMQVCSFFAQLMYTATIIVDIGTEIKNLRCKR